MSHLQVGDAGLFGSSNKTPQVDYLIAAHAIHKLDGIVTPASAAYSASELEYQLRSSGATAIITCLPLLETAMEAAKAVGITEDRIILLSMPKSNNTSQFRTADDLIEEGRSLPPLAPLAWKQGQGKRQTAFLSYSSGTSGLPVRLQKKQARRKLSEVVVCLTCRSLIHTLAESSHGVSLQHHLELAAACVSCSSRP